MIAESLIECFVLCFLAWVKMVIVAWGSGGHHMVATFVLLFCWWGPAFWVAIRYIDFKDGGGVPPSE